MNKPAQTPKRRENASGLATRAKIVEAAAGVLSRDGYHQFTTRRVAEACGISNGNVTYHFPTKQELLGALVDSVVNIYRGEYEARSEHFIRNPSGAFESSVRWVVSDLFEHATGDLFVELWVHAKHAKRGEPTIGGLYEIAFEVYEEMIAIAYPDSAPERRRRAARLLTTLMEGLLVLRQTGALRDMDQEETVESALALVHSIINLNPTSSSLAKR